MSPYRRSSEAVHAANNLQRDDARERARILDIDAYEVEIDVTDGVGGPGDTTFRTATTARFRCIEPGASTFIDLIAARIDEITLNGRSIDPASAYDEHLGRIALDDLADA